MGNLLSTRTAQTKNPLLLPEILCQVFDYLPTKDLKNCHLVCKTWNSAGKPYFGIELRIPAGERARNKYVKRFADTFSLPKNYDNRKTRMLQSDSWEGDLPDVRHSSHIVINSRQLYDRNSLPGGIKLWLIDFPNKLFKSYEISPIFAKHITKLTVIGSCRCIKATERDFTPIAISVDIMCSSLSSLNILHLSFCQLRTTKNTPLISLKEFELDHVQMVKDDQKMVAVNRLFEFSRTKKFCLKENTFVSNLLLDMKDSYPETFTYIHLSSVILQNWRTTKWNIKKLALANITIFNTWENIDMSEMKVNELELSNCGAIHSTFLPRTLEKLQISWKSHPGRFWVESQPINLDHLDNLKNVCLTGSDSRADEFFEIEIENFYNSLDYVNLHLGNEICEIALENLHSVIHTIVHLPTLSETVCAYNFGWEIFIVLRRSSQESKYKVRYVTKLNISAHIPTCVVISLPNNIDPCVFRTIFESDVVTTLKKSKYVVIGPMKWKYMLEYVENSQPTYADSLKTEFFIFEENLSKIITENEFKFFQSKSYCGACKKSLNFSFDHSEETKPCSCQFFAHRRWRFL